MSRNVTDTAGVVRQAKDQLRECADAANRAHEAGERFAAKGLEHYRRAGEKLLEAKTLCGHGKWLVWLEENVVFTQQRASEYTRIAKNWDKLPPGGNFKTLKAALQLFADDPSEEEEPKPEPAKPTRTALPTVPPDEEEEDTDEQPEPDDEEEDKEPESEAEPAKTGKLTGFVTLDEWKGMSARKREKLLLTRGGAKFNSQGSNENIEWALWSWNPVTGCKHDCPYCYARDIAERFYEQKFVPSLWPDRLHAPRNTTFPAEKAREWMGHKNVFVCSMADLFGRWVPSEWIETVLEQVRDAPQWNFLFLTKFPVRMADFKFPDNAWVGTTVDCQARVANAERSFRKVKGGVKWLSCEPMIEPLHFEDIGAFDWVVIGGASRSAQTPEWEPPSEWVVNLTAAARAAGCQVYHKSNLGRVKEYPGWKESREAPAELNYLPKVEKV